MSNPLPQPDIPDWLRELIKPVPQQPFFPPDCPQEDLGFDSPADRAARNPPAANAASAEKDQPAAVLSEAEIEQIRVELRCIVTEYDEYNVLCDMAQSYLRSREAEPVAIYERKPAEGRYGVRWLSDRVLPDGTKLYRREEKDGR